MAGDNTMESSKTKFEVIFCIVNAGYSEMVMDAAREAGVRGGTVIRGMGTANKEAEEKFHIYVQPEKEIVMILVAQKIKDKVLHAIYKAVGLNTAGQGIAFSVLANDVVGTVKKTQARSDAEEAEGNDPSEKEPRKTTKGETKKKDDEIAETSPAGNGDKENGTE